MIKVKNIELLFKENYIKLAEQSRIVYWKGQQQGFNDNIYTSDDLLHDMFFSLKISFKNGSIKEFNDLDHFFAVSYIRLKQLYLNYVKNKWKRSKLENNYFRELGYTYEKADILNGIFDYDLDDNDFKKGLSSLKLTDFINEIENEEQRTILLLKMQDVLNEKICKHFGYKQAELRSKIYNARKKLFKILVKKEIINPELKFKEFVGASTKIGVLHRLVNDKKYLYNDYPFTKTYKEKIEFIIKKNDDKIDLDLLPEVLKYNEGYQLKRDLRAPINYALEQSLADHSCFVLDGVIYLKAS